MRGLRFYPKSLERGCRSEKALKLAIAEMYVMGVSTRKVTEITEQLYGLEISATQVSRVAGMLDEELEEFRSRELGEYPIVYLDAHYVKVRRGGRVQDVAILKAIAVNRFGTREVLGLSAKISEAEVHWREFLADLHKRGLREVELLVRDDHEGLKAARRAVYPSVPWNRCQFHLSKNAQEYARRKEDEPRIAQAMRDIFNAPSREDAEKLKDKVVKKFEKIAPEFVRWLEENVDEGLTVFDYPRSWWKKDPNHQRTGEVEPGDPETNPGGGNLSPRSIGAAAHLGCACGDTRGVVNRPAIPEPGRLEKTSGAILPYRPSRKLQKNRACCRTLTPALLSPPFGPDVDDVVLQRGLPVSTILFRPSWSSPERPRSGRKGIAHGRKTTGNNGRSESSALEGRQIPFGNRLNSCLTERIP